MRTSVNLSLTRIFTLVLLLFSTGLFAAIETASNRLNGTAVATNAVVSAVDNKYNYMVANSSGTPPLWQQNLFALKSGVGRVRLGVDPNCLTFVSAGYTAKVTVNISYYSDLSLSTPQSVSTQTLVVSYDPLTNPANQSLQLDDRDMFEINSTNVLTSGEKVVYVKVTVTAVTDASNTPITAPANLYLEASTEVERFYNLSLTSIPATSILSGTLNSANELQLSWGYIAGAESYDVEWTYINDYDASGGTLSGSPLNALVFDFAHNSTRVNVRGNKFAIPLVFDQGRIAYRIRAVGYAYNSATSTFEPVYGRWTSDNAANFTYGTFSGTGHVYQITLAAAYRLKMNWQYSGSFAEDGKKKEVVAFYDGSLHNRQTITKTSTDKKVLVGETIYDYEGRAAISVLPSPVAGSNIPLDYQVAFNRNSSNVAYSAADFDKDAGSCAVATGTMSTSYGTSRYYSSSNPEQTGAQAFLPNASGYPFAQVEYAPDNTGRVRRQGGVGTTHQLGGGHETQYYYGHPFQEELDRLFGSDVGYAKHYNKTVTIDANGQASVSFVDQEGRTIATGLAGDTINKPLMALREGGAGTTSYSANTVSSMVVDMLGKDNDADVDDAQDNNLINAQGNMLEVSNQLLVAYRTTYSFAYSLTGDKFTYECLPEDVCYNCVYDLEIDIVDQCGNRPSLSQGTLPISQTLGSMTYDCESASASFNNTATPLIATLDPGVYTVYKRLKVNQHALDGYVADYLTETNCVTSQASMISDALAAVDTSSCHSTCAECDDYQSPCETAYRMMLSDVSPNGQYGEFRDNTGAVNTAQYPVSVFNTSNYLRVSNANWRTPSYESNGNAHYYEADETSISYIALSGTSPNYFPAIDNISNVVTGTDGLPYIEPHHLANVDDFVIYWRESWALSLVKYHPEYCYFDWCKGNGVVQSGASSTSDVFDSLLLATNTRSAAITAGLLDPLANSDGTADQSSAIDPYFQTTGLGTSQYSAMETQMRNYSGTNSIWKTAKVMTTCGTMYNASQSQIDACVGSASGNEANYITSDAEWMNFKMLYFSLKQHYQQDKADASAMTCDGYNGCIGTSTFNPAASGMIDYSSFGSSEFFDRTPTRQPCCDQTYAMYSGKQKRFVNEDDVIQTLTGNASTDLAALQTTIYNNNLMSTGQCPMAADLENFFSGLAAGNQLKASSLNLQTVSAFSPGLYTAIVTPSVYTTVSYTGSGTGATLTMALTGNSDVSCSTSPTLVFGASSSYSWANYNTTGGFRIASFSGLVPDGSGGFGIIAWIDHDMNTSTAAIPEYMTGTDGCFDLSCTLPTVCTANSLANDIYTMLNLAAAGGDIFNATGTNLTTGGNYSNFYNGSQLNNYANGCGSGVDTYWRFESGTTPDEHRVQCSNTTGTPSNNWLKLTFSPDLSTLTGTINSFSAPVITSATQMQLTVTHNTTSTTTVTLTVEHMSGATKLSTLNLGTCGAPVPEQCEGAEYQRRTDLEGLLNAKVGSAFTTTDNNLHLNPAFTYNLQQFGTGSYSWTTLSSPSNAQWISIASGTQVCTLKVAFANTPTGGHAFNNIDHFGQVVADETNMVNGQAYDFTVVAWYSGGSSELLYGTSCYAIRNCSVCTSYLTSVYQNFDMVNTGSPGYTSGLTYGSSCPTSTGNYTLTNKASATCSDNTLTGLDRSNQATGKYFYGNFAANTTTTVWSKINTALAINTPYTFNCWYMDPTVNTYTAGATATVQLIVNGTVISSTTVDDTRPGEWKVISGTWNGMSTLANCTTEVKVVTNATSAWKIAFDDISFYTPGCGPTYSPPVSPSFPYNPPCATNLMNIATLNAQQAYAQYAQQVSAQFAADYTAHCIGQAVETFKATFDEKEYQYTLYYYDQAGNLSRTVPPQGVTIINLTADANSNSISNGQEIKNQRNARLSNPTAAKTYYTAHRLMTTYTYNSLDQLVKQVTPDGGTTCFFYDKLGRMVACQNAKQAAQSTQAWSYTVYDALGRISEAGELYTNTDLKTMSSVTLYSTLNASNYPDNWAGAASSNTRKDVTRTYYDVAESSFGVVSRFSTGALKNLRKRVAHTAVYDTYNGTSTAYSSASHYSYDIHGNVEEMVQEISELSVLDDATAGVYQRYKNVRYKYDLLSGNVNELAYQDGQPDRFYYRYSYDADNRVTAAYTSNDKRHWDRDAKYFYYQHGPSSRMEIGNEKVQGMDYGYTLQGWIKVVNSNAVGASYDLGTDAGSGTHAYVSTDEYGFSLGYNSGDFSTIGTSNAIASTTGSGLDAASPNLYNGNIRHMVTTIRYFGSGAMQAMAYKYDQLNRIRSAEQYTNYDTDENEWQSGGSGNTPYREKFTYDHNGNIITLKRNGQSGNTNLDDLHYYYYTTSGGTYDPASSTPSNATNKLAYVTDGISSTYTDDVDNQSSGNYIYDQIGQITGDVQEQIQTIEWTAYGKIKSITRTSGSTKADLEFRYNAAGQRYLKIVKPRTGGSASTQDAWTYSYYVHDAIGNVLASYERVLPKSGSVYDDKIKLKEQQLYGSSRVGLRAGDLILTTKTYNFTSYSGVYLQGTLSSATTPALSATRMKHTMNMKAYEQSNHLGNVLVTVSDARQISNSGSNVTGFVAIVKSATDYSAFGAPMAGRTYTSSSYRYGYNGMEKIDETHNNSGDCYDFGSRTYDARIARWFSKDPASPDFPANSPYLFCSANPILLHDVDGCLQVDPYGRLIVTTTGIDEKPDERPISDVTTNGVRTEVIVVTYFEKVIVYGNDGTPIDALRYTGSAVVTKVTDANGVVTQTSVPNAENQGYECHIDCHGYSFADGKIWINDDQVDKLIKADGYQTGVAEQNATQAIFRNANGDVVHSSVRNSDGTYSSNAGILKTETKETLEQSKRGLNTASTEFVKEGVPGGNVTVYPNAGNGVASGGVCYMTKAEHDACTFAPAPYTPNLPSGTSTTPTPTPAPVMTYPGNVITPSAPAPK